jgi:endonuclease-8
MPEGDTIFRAARTLDRALAGKRVTRFETVLPALARVDEDAPIAGRTVESVASVGKHMLMRFSGDLVLRTHMRMNGSWHIYRPGERWQRHPSHMRLVVATEDFVAVGFDVPVAEFLDSRALARQRTLRALGPDPLGDGFDAAAVIERFRQRGGQPTGEALLDQRVLAGVGNVLRSEILFVARVHPRTPVAKLDDATLARVVGTAQQLLRANVADATRDRRVAHAGMRRTTRRADPAARLWVYGRRGEPCRACGTPIRRDADGDAARLVYWCPRCQPALPLPAVRG